MRKMLSKVIEEAASQSKKVDKIRVLVENDHPALRILLCCALHPGIEWMLPEGTPPYKPNALPFDQEGILYNEVRRLYLFLYPNHIFRDFNPDLSKARREMLFIQLLEMVSKEDSLLLIAAKDKKLHVKGLDAKIVEDAFPGIISQPPVEGIKPSKEKTEA